MRKLNVFIVGIGFTLGWLINLGIFYYKYKKEQFKGVVIINRLEKENARLDREAEERRLERKEKRYSIPLRNWERRDEYYINWKNIK